MNGKADMIMIIIFFIIIIWWTRKVNEVLHLFLISWVSKKKKMVVYNFLEDLVIQLFLTGSGVIIIRLMDVMTQAMRETTLHVQSCAEHALEKWILWKFFWWHRCCFFWSTHVQVHVRVCSYVFYLAMFSFDM